MSTLREELWLVLRPSKIHGVGVFTERPIRKGEYLRMWLLDDWKCVRKPVGRLAQMCHRYGVWHVNGWISRPKSFVRLSIAWYLNHSTKPNVKVRVDGKAFALRRINCSEELTIDYRTLDSDVDNSEEIVRDQKIRRRK